MTKEAMTLALEALEIEDAACRYLKEQTPSQIVEAITAIKQALAAPVQDIAMAVSVRGWVASPWFAQELKKGGVFNLYTTPPAQPAPVQPVAYWIPKAEQFCIADPSGRPFAKAWEPLYTTPPAAQRPWVGLTDEERDDLLDNYITAEGRARAIEAKLKEKNT